MYIVCVCVSSTLRVPFRYPSGSLLVSKLDPLASMGWLWVAWALLAVAPAPIEPEARYGLIGGRGVASSPHTVYVHYGYI